MTVAVWKYLRHKHYLNSKKKTEKEGKNKSIYHCLFRARNFAWNQIHSSPLCVDCPTAPMSAICGKNHQICWQSIRLYRRVHRPLCYRLWMWFVLLTLIDSCWYLWNCCHSTMDGIHRRFEANYLISALQVVLYQWIFDNYSSYTMSVNCPLRTMTMKDVDSLHFQDCCCYYCCWYGYVGHAIALTTIKKNEEEQRRCKHTRRW